MTDSINHITRSIRSSLTVGIATLVLLMLSNCRQDDPTPPKSRDIRFEVSGNFTGELSATYATAGGGVVNEEMPSLPWTKSINYTTAVTGTSIVVAGGGGISGQTIVVKVFAGNKEVSSTPATADNAGILLVTSPAYVF